jgi:hypothetical protein
VKLRGFIKEFGDKYFSTDGEILFCKMCEVKVTADKCAVIDDSEPKDIYSGQNNFVNFIINCHS